MQNENSTTFARWQGVTRISPEESELVELVSARKGQPTGFTFSIPVTTTARCPWCLATVAQVALTSGHEINLELETGDQGESRAVLTSLHVCPEAERWAQFLDAPTEADGLAQ